MVNQASSDRTQLTCRVTHGHALGPVQFSLYTTRLGMVIENYGIDRQLFADDTSFVCFLLPDQLAATVAVQNLKNCCPEIKDWMSSNKLEPNNGKTEAILSGSKTQQSTVSLQSVCNGEMISLRSHSPALSETWNWFLTQACLCMITSVPQ